MSHPHHAACHVTFTWDTFFSLFRIILSLATHLGPLSLSLSPLPPHLREGEDGCRHYRGDPSQANECSISTGKLAQSLSTQRLHGFVRQELTLQATWPHIRSLLLIALPLIMFCQKLPRMKWPSKRHYAKFENKYRAVNLVGRGQPFVDIALQSRLIDR